MNGNSFGESEVIWNWDAIGAIGEIAGVVVVLATLVYLSIQIKQNSKALARSNEYAQASSVHDTNSLFVQVFSLLVQDQEMASIYCRALNKEPLDNVESVRFSSFLHVYFAWSEDMYCQAKAKLGFAEYTGKGSEELLREEYAYWGPLLKTDVGKHWWKKEAVHLFSADFIKAIKEIKSQPAN